MNDDGLTITKQYGEWTLIYRRAAKKHRLGAEHAPFDERKCGC